MNKLLRGNKHILLILTVLTVVLIHLVPVKAEAVVIKNLETATNLPSKVQATTSMSKNTVRDQEQLIYYIDNIEFESSTDKGKEVILMTYINAYDKTVVFDEIIIPRFEMEIDGKPVDVTVDIYQISGIGGTLKSIIFKKDDGVQEGKITYDEIFNLRDGIVPTSIYMIIRPMDDNGNTLYHTAFNKIVQTKPLEYHYHTDINNKVYLETGRQLNQSRIIHNYESGSRNEDVIGSYPYFETVDFNMTSNKLDGVKAGDEIELDFVLKNNSLIANQRLTIGFNAQGLELEGQSAIINDLFVLNQVSENQFMLELRNKDDLTWLKLNLNDEMSFKQTFKVSSTYTDSQINIEPFVFIAGDQINTRYTSPITIELLQDKVCKIDYIVEDANVLSQEVICGQTAKISDMNDLTKEHYSFLGWSEDASSTQQLYQAGMDIEVNSDMILYAMWQADRYSIQYQLDGGINHPTNPDFYVYSEGVNELLSPSKAGYTFEGWMLNSLDGTKVSSIGKEQFGEVTLFASWVKNTDMNKEDGNNEKPAPVTPDGQDNSQDQSKPSELVTPQDQTKPTAKLPETGIEHFGLYGGVVLLLVGAVLLAIKSKRNIN